MTTTMPASVRSLLEHLIDFAGLFPPAKLDMPATVDRYAEGLRGSSAWMIGRVIVPVARLTEFELAADSALPRRHADEPWRISALTGAAGTPQLQDDLESIAAFNERHRDAGTGRAVIDVIELKAGSPGDMEAALDLIADDIYPFFEIPSDRDPRGHVTSLTGSDAGAKIRTGGVTADLYPSPENVARFIQTCAAAGVPFKATAGLHHPTRHHSDAVDTDEFGFLNIFVGAAMAAHLGLDADELVPILTERDAAAFQFDDGGVTWRDLTVETEGLDDVRMSFAVSFGSCSIDEPVDDLRRLGIL